MQLLKVAQQSKVLSNVESCCAESDNYFDNKIIRMNSIAAQCFACFAMNMCSYFVAGMVMGWSTAVLPMLTRADSPIPMDDDQIGWLMSIIGAGAMIGPILTWLFVDKIGRKPVILMCSLPIISSYVIMIAEMNYPFLLFGRVLAGVGLGVALSAVPLYIGEVTDNKVRGALGVICTITMNSGTLFAIVVGPLVSVSDLNMISALMAFVLLFLLMFIPESPYYYLLKGDTAKATESLHWLRRTANVKTELLLMTKYTEKKKSETSGTFDLFTKRGNRRAFIILVLLVQMQMFAGSLAIPVFAYEIFSESGLDISLDTLVIIMSTVTLVASVVGVFVVNTLGRRSVLFLGTVVMTISLIANSAYFTLKVTGYDVSGFTYLPFVAVLGYTIGNSCGPHSLPPIVLSEYFSTNVKAKAAMCYTVLMAIGGTVSVKLFQLSKDEFGLGTTFFLCCLPLIVGILVLYFMMPETKGCTLQTIEDMHKGDVSTTVKNSQNGSRTNPI